MDDSLISLDISGLKKAYLQGKPLVIGDTLYIPGTRRPTDLLDDLLIGSPFFDKSFAVTDGGRTFARNRVKIERVVGHSLGGAVASHLGRKHKILSVGYGSPVQNDLNYSSPYDPVSMFVRSNKLVNNSLLHHMVEGYVKPVVYGISY